MVEKNRAAKAARERASGGAAASSKPAKPARKPGMHQGSPGFDLHPVAVDSCQSPLRLQKHSRLVCDCADLQSTFS